MQESDEVRKHKEMHKQMKASKGQNIGFGICYAIIVIVFLIFVLQTCGG